MNRLYDKKEGTGVSLFRIRGFCAIPSICTAGTGSDLRSDETLEAQPAGRMGAKRLDVLQRSSLLRISRKFWSADGEPTEIAPSSYRGDWYRAVLRIPPTAIE